MLPTMERIGSELALRYRLAIITSSVESPVTEYFEDKKIRHCFDAIFDMNVHRSKVVKFGMARERYGASVEDCIFITDTLGDIREANNAGVQTIAVTWGFHDRATLQRGSPYAIIDTPAELIPTIHRYFS